MKETTDSYGRKFIPVHGVPRGKNIKPSSRKGAIQAMYLGGSQIKQMRWMKDNLTNHSGMPELPDDWDWGCM